MTTLLEAAYIQDNAKKAIKTVEEVLELVEFGSEVWTESTDELSENCIKVTHKAYELLVCFIRFVLCDGVVKTLSEEVLEKRDNENFYVSSNEFETLDTFITGFIKVFITKIDLVITEIVELPKTLAELKIIAKDLKVPSYASFKSIINLQKAIQLKTQ